MSEFNKSYRIKTDVGNNEFISIDTNLIQDYDTLDILSIKLKSVDIYRLHNSNYGVVVGRVLANNGFGIPNAKLSIFIDIDNNEGELVRELYPFTSSHSVDTNGVRYNLLPDEKVADCHQAVGTFPNKRYMLDNDVVLEVFDKYYKYTTRTNNAGDYLIMGVPVGTHTLHMDLDLSDCGILSQKPRDFVYKGYTIEQFENPSMFKSGTNYGELSQIFTQDQIINVQPFWGNESLGETIGLTRADINVAFKFETTCVFLGCVASDNASNGITKKCMATENMGNMEEMTTGEGTIEMIRKTPSGEIESFQVRGTQLINSNGVWCYQIPMNLDYMMTDEYGNMVPTDDPEKGIPTRASVRFRISMQDNEENLDNFYRAKVLVPHNPQTLNDGFHEEYDYEFGTYTRDDSFRDLFWDNVYSVKSYIPRFQKKKVRGWRDKKFTGIKSCNFYGNNNPMPYNNMRIRLPLMFTIMCAIVKGLVLITTIFNEVIHRIADFLYKLGTKKILGIKIYSKGLDSAKKMTLNVLTEGLCPDLENWFFAPLKKNDFTRGNGYDILKQTMNTVDEGLQDAYDKESIDYQNQESEENITCLTTSTNYLLQCIEMNLAMEYRVINFDFYNDWINGLIYIPRFMRYIRPKRTFLGIRFAKAKTRGCMDNTRIFAKTRRYTQQCSMGYKISNNGMYTSVNNPIATNATNRKIKKSNNFHKKSGFNQVTIFGKNGGVCHEHTTSRKQNVYYMKPCEWKGDSKVNLFATDIILLGSLKSCDENGLPQAFKYLSSTSYIMPTNLALTNMETNGPLYTNNKGTICAGNSQQLLTDDTLGDDKGVSVLSPNMGIVSELEAYSKTGDENIDTQYEGNELSDIIPLTEAAGISWDYTGPGQGEINKSLMYYPGGHFLGLSCVNAQSNIKSCVNLTRICEVGTVMSQRKEDIAFIDNNGKMTYVYTAPTGVISGDDINGEDFRTMFATMNQNRLQATKFNPETGYYYYDFSFLKPIYFDGTFKNVVEKGNSVYNTKIEIPTEDKRLLNKYGISYKNDFEEIDSNNVSTQTKTKEYESKDYYSFRFGLDNSELNKNSFLQKIKFLKTEGNYKYLPQYENSYYFYFGMKAGASAIDEFNKQFFSVCDTTIISHGNPSMNINLEEFNVCEQKTKLKIILDNIELPLQSITYTHTHDGVVDNAVDITLVNDGDLRSKYVFNPIGNIKDKNGKDTEFFKFGIYDFDIIDSNGIHLRESIEVGTDLFTVLKATYDFNVNDANVLKREGSDNTKNIYNGGYIKIENILVNELYNNIVESSLTISIKEVQETFDDKEETLTIDYIYEISGETFEEGKEIYLLKSNVKYNLYVNYRCDGASSYNEVYIDTFTLRDGQTTSLCMGWPNIAYNKISTSGKSEFFMLTTDGEEEIITSASTNEPYLNYGSGTTWWDNSNLNSTSTDSVSNWVKRVSIYKTNESNETFSNNVFTTTGRKVLWGPGQNEENIKDVVYCTELENIEEGYSLDDDASYWPSNSIKYSALAVDGSVVGGDYFAILSGGTIEHTGCKGVYPLKNSGYVFKTLPDGELYFYTYQGNSLEKPSEYNGAGIYYSSFNYPVKEKQFNVFAKFFIWAGYGVEENPDNSFPSLKYEELAGRTEMKITGGIRYKQKLDKFGDTENVFTNNLVSFVDNQIFENFTGTGLTINGVSGMNVVLVTEDEDGYEIREKIPAYDDKGYAMGVTGVTEVYYDIYEGYPNINQTFKELVNNKSWSINYDSYFPTNVAYEIKEGRGLDVFTTGEGGNGSGRGMICITNDNTFLTTTSSGSNSYYIYIKQGSSEPTYYILCKYKNEKDGKEEIINDGYTFLRIRYFNKRRFYQEYYKQDGTFIKTGKHKKAKSIRNNIEALLNRDTGWTSYMNVVPAKSLNCNTKDWEKEIEQDALRYEVSGATLIENNKISAETIYYVDKIEEAGNTLYKIYPNFEELKRKDDGIVLNLYRVTAGWSGKTGVTITLECDLDKTNYSSNTLTVEEIEILNNSIIYETNNGKSGYLKFIYNNNPSPQTLNEEIIISDFYKLTLTYSDPSVIGDDDEEGGVYEYWVSIKLTFKLDILSGNTSGATDEKYDQIYFYLTNAKNGERLDIIRESEAGNSIYFSLTPDGGPSEKINELEFTNFPSSKKIYALYKVGKIHPSALYESTSNYTLANMSIGNNDYKIVKIKHDVFNEYKSYYSIPCRIYAYPSVSFYTETITVKAIGLTTSKLKIIGNVNNDPKIVFLANNEQDTIDSKELFMIPNSGNSTQYIIVYNNTGEECEPYWDNSDVGLELEKDNEKVSKTNITYYKVVQTDMGHDPYPKYDSNKYPSSNIIKIQNNNEIGSSLNVVIKPYCMFRIKNTITNEYINDFKILIVFDPYSEYKDYYKETYLRTENQPTYYEKYHVLFEDSGEQEETIVPPIPYNSSDIPFEISIISGTIPDENVKGFGCIMLGTQPIMSNTYNNGTGITSSYFDVKKYNIGIGDNQGELRTLRLANLYDNFIINANVSFVNKHTPPPNTPNYKNIFDGYMTMYQKRYDIYEKEIFRCNNSYTSNINYQSGDGYEDLCRLNIVIYDEKTNDTNIDVSSTDYSYNVNIEGANDDYDSFPIYNKTNNRISTYVDEKNRPIIIIDNIRISSLFTIGGNIKITVTLMDNTNGNI